MITDNNYLIIGNGFDIAHGFKTAYTDFLPILKQKVHGSFSEAFEKVQACIAAGRKWENDIPEFWKPYIECIEKPENVDIKEIRRMEELLQKNSWAKYYGSCNAEIQGWIDFEAEMKPVFSMFQELFSAAKGSAVIKSGDKPEVIISNVSNEVCRMARLWGDFIGSADSTQHTVRFSSKYCDFQYGLFKEKILDDLKRDLDNFIEAFRIYLVQIVGNQKFTEDTVISNIKATEILSFNYTNTEQRYGNLKDAKTHYIHGSVNAPGSMVLGVNEVENDSDDLFIYFVKYFQRIRRRIGNDYRHLSEGKKHPYYLTVYGHSLDITDEDILKPLLDYAKGVTIYFYDDMDYEKKVINLIKMSDKDIVQERLFEGKYNFVPTR